MSTSRAVLAPNGGAVGSLTPIESDNAALARSIRKPARVGLALTATFVLCFGVWGSTVPLAGGAVAPGFISPESNRKTVQHLEGGIIRTLAVRDGDVVQIGQPLVVLEDVQPRTAYDALNDQFRTLLATQARLEAEQANAAQIQWPAELRMDGADPALRTIVEGQRQLFETRRASHAARKVVLRQRVEQLQEQIRGLAAQVESASRQYALISDEVEGKAYLLSKELIPKPEVLKLQRAQAEIMGRRAEYTSNIARARQQIGEAEMQLLQLDAERAEQISTQTDQVRTELAGVRERLSASADVLKRTVVTAPVSGTVVNSMFKTEGGVVRGGDPIMDIVPAEDVLLIDAHVSPNDIDVVHVGLPARVRLSAFSTKRVPPIDGVVRSVSADHLIDEQSKLPYYLARVEVDRAELKRVAPQAELVPGMPAEALIVTGERTMLQYLFEPFRDALWRSFREV